MLLPRQTKSESNITTFKGRQTTFLRFQLLNKLQSNVAPAPVRYSTWKYSFIYYVFTLSHLVECLCLQNYNSIKMQTKIMIMITIWDFEGYRCYVRLDILRQLESKKRTSTSMKSCDVWLGFSSTWKQQLSKIKLVKEKKEKDWVRLMLTPTKAFFLSFFLSFKTKIASNFLTMHQILILTMDLNWL